MSAHPACAARDAYHAPHDLAGPGGNKPGARCDGKLYPLGTVLTYRPAIRHCREGIALVRESGVAYDTFWGSGADAHMLSQSELATAEVRFTLGDEWRELDRHAAASPAEWANYAEGDRQRITHQHGLQARWFVRAGASHDPLTMIANAEQAAESARYDLEAAQRAYDRALERLTGGDRMTTTATTEQAVTTGGRYHRTKPYAQTDRALCGVPVRFVLERKPVADVADAERCRRCWWTPRGARLEKSALQEYAGVRAKADGGICDRCDGAILKDQRIVKRTSSSGERWIHAGCASGQDQ